MIESIVTAAQMMSLWEVIAVICAIAYLLLAVKENVWCWLFALISTLIYTALFWNVSLLMDSALNIYYMAMAVFGWYQWTRGGAITGHANSAGSNTGINSSGTNVHTAPSINPGSGNGDDKASVTSISSNDDDVTDTRPQPLAVRSMNRRQHGWLIAITAVLTVISGYLLSEHSNAAWPYVDSFTTWASVLTTYLVTQKYLQNWLYWVVIDVVAIPLYIDRGLTLTALLFVFYVVIAVFGYLKWRQHLYYGGQPDAA